MKLLSYEAVIGSDYESSTWEKWKPRNLCKKYYHEIRSHNTIIYSFDECGEWQMTATEVDFYN